MQKARQEWQRFHPVSRKAHRPLQKRFEQAITPLQTHLDQARHQSAAHKESLIEQARILLTLEDVFSAAQQAKQLQQEWKNIAPLNRRQEREYWHEFRTLCDQIFAHRDHERQQQKAAYAQAWQTLSEQIQALAHQVAHAELTANTHADFLRQHQVLTLQLAELPAKHAQNKACSQALLQIETQLKQQQETLARAPFWSLWQALSLQPTYADVHTLDAQVQQHAQPEWQPQLAWWRQAYALATPAKTLEEQQKLYVRFKLLSGQTLEPEYQALKMSIQVERLTQGLGQNTTQEAQAQQTQELLALVISWLLTSLDTPEVLQTSFQQSLYAWCHPEPSAINQ
ncbi:protein of unknown function [Allopseudospirillum japonicum]|uniref:DUF349 domain-containing protein n=1 Tax=Allopseudospirillum japonicum TaxID=64971 RepID=A0A1H6RMN8_9GAMM|nr:DUF349 domain-containing protein [Allopseudospirillum japonicum]SEI52865.1 protein of unknown function [Allopseudospirillum japonicum]